MKNVKWTADIWTNIMVRFIDSNHGSIYNLTCLRNANAFVEFSVKMMGILVAKDRHRNKESICSSLVIYRSYPFSNEVAKAAKLGIGLTFIEIVNMTILIMPFIDCIAVSELEILKRSTAFQTGKKVYEYFHYRAFPKNPTEGNGRLNFQAQDLHSNFNMWQTTIEMPRTVLRAASVLTRLPLEGMFSNHYAAVKNRPFNFNPNTGPAPSAGYGYNPAVAGHQAFPRPDQFQDPRFQPIPTPQGPSLFGPTPHFAPSRWPMPPVSSHVKPAKEAGKRKVKKPQANTESKKFSEAENMAKAERELREATAKLSSPTSTPISQDMLNDVYLDFDKRKMLAIEPTPLTPIANPLVVLSTKEKVIAFINRVIANARKVFDKIPDMK